MKKVFLFAEKKVFPQGFLLEPEPESALKFRREPAVYGTGTPSFFGHKETGPDQKKVEPVLTLGFPA